MNPILRARSRITLVVIGIFVGAVFCVGASAGADSPSGKYGPEAAFQFARGYRGETCSPKETLCYPDAKGVPFEDCENILPMSSSLWTPAQVAADFRARMQLLPPNDRKKGIIVVLKTERCAPKAFRGCTVTTAALEKRSTPLVGEFQVYGVLLKPRDGDRPPGKLKIETGDDAWKNEAAGEYTFRQGPGATIVFIDPVSGRIMDHTDAARLELTEAGFEATRGRTPRLEAKLSEILARLN
jgi:hypothetical protein